MKSCTSSMTTACGRTGYDGCSSLSQMVDRFLADRSDRCDQEAAWWGNPDLSFAETCRRVMFALGAPGIRDSHQWTYRVLDLKEAGKRLERAASRLQAARSFEQLYVSVEAALGLAPGAKPLLVYDVTRRLGYRFDLSPQAVYLHAGAKAGANALCTSLGRGRSRPISDFPTSIRTRLAPAQAEDFLCLASRYLGPALWD